MQRRKKSMDRAYPDFVRLEDIDDAAVDTRDDKEGTIELYNWVNLSHILC